MSVPEIIGLLRQATGDRHRALEAGIDLERRLAHPDSRRDLVGRFAAFQAVGEAAVTPWLAQIEGLGFDTRRRAGQVRADHLSLGGTDPGGAMLRRTPECRGEALGLLYVLEGSTLGGHVIHRAQVSAGRSLEGLGFFDPYGPRTGEMWRSFMDVLRREHAAGRAGTEAVLRGGRDGFDSALDILCGERSAA